MLALLLLLACVLLRGDGGEILGGGDAAAGAGEHGFYYENLALVPGVEVTADSVENDLVKVQCTGCPEFFLIGQIDIGNLLQPEIPFGLALVQIRL